MTYTEKPPKTIVEVDLKQLLFLKKELLQFRAQYDLIRSNQKSNEELLDKLRNLLKMHIEDPKFFENKQILQADLKLCVKLIEELLLPF